jgi:hypothetical protein
VKAKLLVRPAMCIPGLWDALLVDSPLSTGEWHDLTRGQLRQVIAEHPNAAVQMCVTLV